MTRPLWWESPDVAPAASGLSPSSADVVVVGGGYTGLWTAYYLLKAEPALDVVVLEAEHVGFGASGRNGGWVSALWPVGPETIARRYGRAASLALQAALRETVDEVGRAVEANGIHCGFTKGGMLAVARSQPQMLRARAEVAQAQQWGLGTVWLPAGEARERLRAEGTVGATFNPHCARVHPRALVDGLARAVRAAGGVVLEGSRVRSLAPGRVVMEDGRTITARHVVRATEAWTPTLAGQRRTVAPVYSLMVATEPLSSALWDQIGLASGEVFTDHRLVVTYGQRTVDGRLAFGGRGAPYHFGSRVRPQYDEEPGVFDDLRATLTAFLPQLGGVTFTHAWGGPLGIARDWHPSVGYDASTGLGWAGGYVGDGVAATNLAGRTLADLITGRQTGLTELPWVGHRSRRWEPEPARWVGINAGLRLAHAADRHEARSGRPSRLAPLLAALTGH